MLDKKSPVLADSAHGEKILEHWNRALTCRPMSGHPKLFLRDRQACQSSLTSDVRSRAIFFNTDPAATAIFCRTLSLKWKRR